MSIKLPNNISLKPDYSPEIGCIEELKLSEPGSGNLITIYKDGWSLKRDEINNLTSGKDNCEKIKSLADSNFLLIKYFSKEELQKYKINNTSLQGISHLKHNPEHQNCLVVQRNIENGSLEVYAHPKVRPNAKSSNPNEHFGVNHSSLCGYNKDNNPEGKVAFAGSIFFKPEGEIIVNNATGHYGTRPSKISTFLEAAQSNNIALDNVIIEHLIIKDNLNGANLTDANNYESKTIKATDLLSRIEKLSTKSKKLKKDINTSKEDTESTSDSKNSNDINKVSINSKQIQKHSKKDKN